MGIDWGARRVGIAISDSGTIATPHSVLRNEGDIAEKLATLARELDAETIVLGVARNAPKFHDLAERLRQKTCKPVVLWDEELSTVEAAEQLRASGKNRRDAQRDIDMHAAAVILQSYLDHRSDHPGGGHRAS